jgi:WD40 repeat protein
VFLYGASGDGKSSLVSAGLMAAVVARRDWSPERIRVQPRDGEEIVVERIARSEADDDRLPSLLAPDGDASPRFVMSAAAFEARVRDVCAEGKRPLLVFDQFEEVVTLFEERQAIEAQHRVAETLATLLREPLAVKLLFVFREDYLGKIKRLLAAVPELVDQALHLEALGADKLPAIVRGPFERFPGHFERELDRELADRVCAAFDERIGSGELSLSEVQLVAQRLWQSDDPHALLRARGVQGLLEDELGAALQDLPADLRDAAIAVLAQMVTAAGTRNVISADDVAQRVCADDPDISPQLVASALQRLEREARLVRRERRRDTYLYEIASEFLVPWISERRQALILARERARARRRYGSIAGALLVVVAIIAAVAIWALGQRSAAQREASTSAAYGLAAASTGVRATRPDIALLLGLAAYRQSPVSDARRATLEALIAARAPGLSAILHGHSGAVSDVAVSPDGHTLVSGGDDATVRLWDARTHRQVGGPLGGHAGAVVSVAFSPDGRVIASAGTDGTIRLWSRDGHRQLASLHGHTATVMAVAFSPSGAVLASGSSDGTLRLWSPRTHRTIRVLRPADGRVVALRFSPDGRLLAFAGDTAVWLWDLRTRRLVGSPLRTRADQLAFSPGGRILATAGFGRRVRLWSTRSRRAFATLDTHARKADVNGLAFAPGGRALAVADDHGAIRLYDPRSGERVGRRLTAGNGSINALAFTPDGRTLVAADDDNTVRLWEPGARANLDVPLAGHRGDVSDVAFSADGRTLASTGADGTVRLWDVGSLTRIGRPLSLNGAVAQSLAFSRDGPTLAVPETFGGSGIRLFVDPAAPGSRTGHIAGHGLTGLYGIAFSPDGQTLAAADIDGTVRLWSPRSRRQLGRPLTANSRTVAFSPDGETLATGNIDGTVQLWDARTRARLGKPLEAHVDPVLSLSFSPDSRVLASSGYDGKIRLWDWRARRQLGPPLVGHRSGVRDVAFSPRGDVLASAGADGTVRLWDVRAHKQLATLLRAPDPVDAVAFGPDGRTLASAGGDGMVRVWVGLLWRSDVELTEEVCHLVGDGLTRAEWAQFAGSVHYRKVCP